MSEILFGEIYKETVKDRDGYDCGTRTEAYYIKLRDDGTVECFEEALEQSAINPLLTPDATGTYTVTGETITFNLKRKGPDEHDVMATALDTYGPLEPLDVVFITGASEGTISDAAIKRQGRSFRLISGDMSLLSSDSIQGE